MLATAGLVLALRTAACPDHVVEEGVISYCPNHDTEVGEQTKKHLCVPATATTPCCYGLYSPRSGLNPDDLGLSIMCSPKSFVANRALPIPGGHLPCNARVALTEIEVFEPDSIIMFYSSVDCTAESALSAGATAGIVVGGILGPFALGLAYKTLT